jgi:hypothetical protein
MARISFFCTTCALCFLSLSHLASTLKRGGGGSVHTCADGSILWILHMSDAGGWILDQDQHEAGSQPMSGLSHFPSTYIYLHSYVCTGTAQRPYYTTPCIVFEHQTQTQCRFHTERYPRILPTIAPPLSLNFPLSIYSRLILVGFLFLEISKLVENGLLGVYHSNQIHINLFQSFQKG